MLKRVWRKGYPLTQLVGMQTSTATMENSVETQRDGMGREEGGGFRMGNTCIPVADSF